MHISEWLNQRVYWISRYGQVQLTEMEADHKLRSARWLYRSADKLSVIASAELSLLGKGDKAVAIIAQKPELWMQQTELFKALVEGTGYNPTKGDAFRIGA